MHIAQLEEDLGLSRASIRFYEKEGLLSPERLANGYRDYSEEDLETLRRVKLLRALGLPLEDIKALQAGTLDLSAALRAQEERLRREQRQREAALSLCQTLEGEGVAYRDLEAGPYLEELSRLEREGVRLQPPAADSLPCAPYPWRRFFARQLDRSLLSLLFSAVLSLVLRRRLGDGLPWDLFETYLLWGIQFLVEPLLLSTWGTTPGKWIFGLQVRSSDGRKLTFGEAASRLWELFRYGEGYGIPFYNLYRNYKSFRACADGEVLPWDQSRELSYSIRDTRPWRGAAWLGAVGLDLSLALLLAVHITIPPVRHPLTVAEFARNYNDAVRQYELSSLSLDSKGQWVVPEGTLDLGREGAPPIFHYTTAGDGTLTGLTFTYRTPPEFFGSGTLDEQTAALLAMLAAQPEAGFLNWLGLIETVSENMGRPFEDYTFPVAGLTVTNEAAYSGYEIVGDAYLFPAEGEEQTFSQTFSITRTAE